MNKIGKETINIIRILKHPYFWIGAIDGLIVGGIFVYLIMKGWL